MLHTTARIRQQRGKSVNSAARARRRGSLEEAVPYGTPSMTDDRSPRDQQKDQRSPRLYVDAPLAEGTAVTLHRKQAH